MDKNLPGFSPLLRASWEQYKNNWKSFTKVYLLGMLYGSALMGIAALGYLIYTFLPAPKSVFIFIGGALLIYLMLNLLVNWISLSVASVVMGTTQESAPMSARDIFESNRKLVIPYFLVNLLSTLIVFGGYIALVIPGILFSFWFTVSLYTFYIDGARGVSALILSRDYIKGYVTKIFIYYLVIAIVFGLLLQTLPTYLLDKTDIKLWSLLYRAATAIIFTPIIMIFTYRLYGSLKQIKGVLPKEFSNARKWKYRAMAFIPLILFALLSILVLGRYGSLIKLFLGLPR